MDLNCHQNLDCDHFHAVHVHPISLSVNHVERHATREGKGLTLLKLGSRDVHVYRAPLAEKEVMGKS